MVFSNVTKIVFKEGTMKNGITLVFTLLFITGCSTINKSHIYKPVDVTIDGALGAEIHVNADKKLRGAAQGTYLFGFIKVSGPNKYADGYGGIGYIDNCKSAAVYDALSKSEGDLLIYPQYKIVEENYLFYQMVKVEASGYEGKIKLIKSLKLDGDNSKIELNKSLNR